MASPGELQGQRDPIPRLVRQKAGRQNALGPLIPPICTYGVQRRNQRRRRPPTPVSGSPRRCRASGAGRGCPRDIHTGAELVDRNCRGRRKLVDKVVDQSRDGFVIYVLPEGAARERRAEITSRFSEPGPVASGASVPGRDGVPASSPGGSTGRDRHPGVGTLVGPAEVAGHRPSTPGRSSGGPHSVMAHGIMSP
jgi:hypothetical protein